MSEKSINTKYLDEDGWIRGSKAVGYVEYNDQTEEHDMIVDGRRFTIDEFKKNLVGNENNQFKIEFGDETDVFE